MSYYIKRLYHNGLVFKQIKWESTVQTDRKKFSSQKPEAKSYLPLSFWLLAFGLTTYGSALPWAMGSGLWDHELLFHHKNLPHQPCPAFIVFEYVIVNPRRDIFAIGIFAVPVDVCGLRVECHDLFAVQG